MRQINTDYGRIYVVAIIRVSETEAYAKDETGGFWSQSGLTWNRISRDKELQRAKHCLTVTGNLEE